MQVEIGLGTILSIAVTIFLTLLTVMTGYLYKISVNLDSLNTTTETKLDATNNTLERIEQNLNNLMYALHRGGPPSQPPQSSGSTEVKETEDPGERRNSAEETEDSGERRNSEGSAPGTPFFGVFDREDDEYTRRSAWTLEIDGMKTVITPRIGNSTTTFEIKPAELERQVKEANSIEEMDLSRIPHPYLDLDVEDRIVTLSREIFNTTPDIVYDMYTVLIIVPSTDRESIREFEEELIRILPDYAKQ